MPTSNSTTYCVVYRIVCLITKKCYVGQTVDIYARRKSHFNHLKRNQHHSTKLQVAYNAYGKRAFLFEILERDIHPDLIDSREIFWIAHFDSFHNGYNMTIGGQDQEKHTKPCHWNGIPYESINQAAEACGITPSTMTNRLQLGYTCDSDMVGKGNTVALWKGRACTWNGVSYPTITAAARANSMDEALLRFRLNRGYTCDTDVPVQPKPCVWNGVRYPSINMAGRAIGVDSRVLGQWIKRGYACDDDVPNRS